MSEGASVAKAAEQESNAVISISQPIRVSFFVRIDFFFVFFVNFG
jgi:hypothetical protein